MYKQMAAVIALSCACATAMAGYGFEPLAALAPEAAAARAVTIGDVTGDGRDDVVMLAVGSHPFYRNRVIFYAQTPGGFAPAMAIDYHPEPTAYDAAGTGLGLADLDADGDLDIVVSHGGYPFAALVVLRNDAGSFSASTFTSQESLGGIKFMDVNGDGHLDLIGQSFFGQINIFPGDGAAGFGEPYSIPYDGYESSYHLADMDGDGTKDFVYQTSRGIYVRRHTGSGFSATPRTLLTLGNSGYYAQLAIADFDGDARADLAIGFNTWRAGMTYIYPQGVDGTFRRKHPAGRTPYVNGLQAGDVDGDGRQDLLTLDQSFNSQLNVLFARAGGFVPAAAYAVGSTSNFTLGDINSDGRNDVVLYGNNGSVSYLLGRPEAMEGDLAVFLGLNAGAAVVRVENRSADFGVGPYQLDLLLDPRVGSASAGALPSDCNAYTNEDGSLTAFCQMPALAPGAHHERAFTFGITSSTPRTLLFGRARASQAGAELRLDNNVATKRISITTPAN